jgi:hypothetical protein
MASTGPLDLVLATGGAQAPFLVLMVATGALLGGIVFALLCVPRMRREQFRGARVAPRWFGIAAGVLLCVCCSALGWWQVGSSWSALRVGDDRLEVVYHFPTRVCTIERERLEAVRETIGTGKGGSWHVVLVDRAGHRHQSVAVRPEVSQGLVQALHAWATPAGPR